MKEYQKRVVEEQQRLEEQLTKLSAFLSSQAADSVPHEEVTRMVRQEGIMEKYNAVLKERIAAFGAEPVPTTRRVDSQSDGTTKEYLSRNGEDVAMVQYGNVLPNIAVRSCARCGQDHMHMRFKALANPTDSFKFWAICPVTQDPIMLEVVDKPKSPYSERQHFTPQGAPLMVDIIAQENTELMREKGFTSPRSRDEVVTLPPQMMLIHLIARQVFLPLMAAVERARKNDGDEVIRNLHAVANAANRLSEYVGVYCNWKGNPDGLLSKLVMDYHQHMDVKQVLIATEIAEAIEGDDLGQFADVVLRMGQIAGEMGFSIDAALEKEMAHNAGRPMLHGKVC